LALPNSAVRQDVVVLSIVLFFVSLAALKYMGVRDPAAAFILIAASIALPNLVMEYARLPGDSPPRATSVASARLARVGIKLFGLLATFIVIAAAYWALPIYREGQAHALRALLVLIGPALLVLAPAYVWITDSRMSDPCDGCYMAGLAAAGRWTEIDRPMLGQHVLGWTVKAYFLPLMAGYALDDTAWFLALDLTGARSAGPYGWYEFLYRFVFFADVLWATLGYGLTLRLFDTHIRSTEPTMAGWIVCIVCYHPFWGLLLRNYVNYDDGHDWGLWLAGAPAIGLAWAIAITMLNIVYFWATASFGVRFSNLTHRGILTNGPYRFSKHPAYLAKNLTWWLISVPFISAAAPSEALRLSVLLLLVNGIYVLRARTEERHLGADPVYRGYVGWMAQHSLIAGLKCGFLSSYAGLTRVSSFTAPRALQKDGRVEHGHDVLGGKRL
jgi:protein-S-isoprenylcysteine O-methyltransferase Ste14